MSQEKEDFGTEGRKAMTDDEIEKHIATLVQCGSFSTAESIAGDILAGRAGERKRDYEEAVRQYRYVIEKELPQNHTPAKAQIYAEAKARAQNNLGRMYANGWGVERDFLRAYMWFHLAATYGLEKGKKNCEKMEKIMDEEQIAKAKRMADKCREQNYRGC